MLDERDLGAMQARIDLYELSAQHTQLRKKGQREFTGPCPFCHSGRDRFNVQPGEGRWLCRCGCSRYTDSRWHDAWAFFSALNNDDAKAGLRALREYTGGGIPVQAKVASVNSALPQHAERRPPAAGWQSAAWNAIVECEALLREPEGAKARKWLYEVRGLDAWIWEEFHLGFNPEARMIDGLGRVERGIIIPHIDKKARIWEINIRLGTNTGQRYVCVPGSVKGSLYGVEHCAEAAMVVITEGEFDCLLLWQVLCKDGIGVATTGATGGHTTANITSPHVTLPLLEVKTLLVATDNDHAGSAAAANWCAATKRARRIVVPSGKDITEYWQVCGGRDDYGAGYDALRDWMLDVLEEEAA